MQDFVLDLRRTPGEVNIVVKSVPEPWLATETFLREPPTCSFMAASAWVSFYLYNMYTWRTSPWKVNRGGNTYD